MEVNTLEFWQKVKEEYNPKIHYWICPSSKTFEKAWNMDEGNEEIKNLRMEFVFKTKPPYRLGTSFLFIGSKSDIRISFIDWCIKKFEI